MNIKVLYKKWLAKLQTLSDAVVIRLFYKRMAKYEALVQRTSAISKLFKTVAADVGISVDSAIEGAPSRKRKAPMPAMKRSSSSRLILEDFDTPDRDELAEKNVELHELDEAIIELTAFETRLKGTKASSRKALQDLKRIREEVQAKQDAVLDVLESIEQNHVPPIMATMSESLYRHLNRILDDSEYDTMSFHNYHVSSHETVAGKADGAVEFTRYLYIDGLDTEAYKGGTYIFVLTCVVHEEKIYRTVTQGLPADIQAEIDKIEADIRKEETAAKRNRQKQIAEIDGELERYTVARDKKKVAELQKKRKDLLESETGGSTQKIVALIGKRDKLATTVKSTYKRSTGKTANTVSFHLTTIARFANPGQFDPGQPLRGNNLATLTRSLEREADILLAMHSMLPVSNKIPFEFAAFQLAYSEMMKVAGVISIDENNGDILVKVATRDPNIIRNDIWFDLNAALQRNTRKRKNAQFMYRMEKPNVMRVTLIKGS